VIERAKEEPRREGKGNFREKTAELGEKGIKDFGTGPLGGKGEAGRRGSLFRGKVDLSKKCVAEEEKLGGTKNNVRLKKTTVAYWGRARTWVSKEKGKKLTQVWQKKHS